MAFMVVVAAFVAWVTLVQLSIGPEPGRWSETFLSLMLVAPSRDVTGW